MRDGSRCLLHCAAWRDGNGDEGPFLHPFVFGQKWGELEGSEGSYPYTTPWSAALSLWHGEILH